MMREGSSAHLLMPLTGASPTGEFPGIVESSHGGAVKRVIEEMSRRLGESLSLKEMSDIAYISPYHFNRIFRNVTGIPPCQFLWALRLEAAKRLLLTTDISVTDVCFEVGYNSLGTFTRRFTELIGLAPRRFRLMPHSESIRKIRLIQYDPDLFDTVKTPSLSGNVLTPPGFNGLIFLGLFKTPIPQGEPLAGAVRHGAGYFHMAHVPDGHYYLLGAGLPFSTDPTNLFMNDMALRGGQFVCVKNGKAYGLTHLTLRPPDPFDPPILITLPWLLIKQKRALNHSFRWRQMETMLR